MRLFCHLFIERPIVYYIMVLMQLFVLHCSVNAYKVDRSVPLLVNAEY